jgi:hypothetical protein
MSIAYNLFLGKADSLYAHKPQFVKWENRNMARLPKALWLRINITFGMR